MYGFLQRKNVPYVSDHSMDPQPRQQAERSNRPTTDRVEKGVMSYHPHESSIMSCVSHDEPVLNLFPRSAFAESARSMIRIVNRFGQIIATVTVDSVLPTRIIIQISQDFLNSFISGCNI